MENRFCIVQTHQHGCKPVLRVLCVLVSQTPNQKNQNFQVSVLDLFVLVVA